MDIIGMIIRNAVFPLMERLKGNHIRSYTQELRQTQYGDVLQLQRKKLSRLLIHCFENVPFYRKYSHLKQAALKDPFSALEMLPVLDRQTFMKHNRDFLADGIDTGKLITNRTGGSTGEPVSFLLDRKTVEYYEAARWRGLAWWNIQPGDGYAMFWGSPVELSQHEKLMNRLKDRLLKNRIILPSSAITPHSMRDHANRLCRFKPVYIYGYTSALHMFSRYLNDQGLKLPFVPRAVVTTSETLFEEQRQDIEKAFGCSVVNEYGARDGGILAYECRSGNMHITSENTVLETVDIKDGTSVRPENMGEVLVTDLNNYSMPRLRYRLGDAAQLSEKCCDCGVLLPVLEKIQGRTDELFLSKNGTLVTSHLINTIMREQEGIGRYRLTQHTPDKATLEICSDSPSAQQQFNEARNAITQVLGGVDVTVKCVCSLEASGSGKFRYAIRSFPLKNRSC